jgi:2-succinyl-5-enolpyruvyl-6-hydroxy-3-cyclohexene-1-carboxylate synthase
VVVDNGGGGLFDLLPQSEHAPSFDRLFITPHGLDLSHLAAVYGIDSTITDDVAVLGEEMESRLEAHGAHLIVVPVEREADLKARRSMDDTARAVRAALS